MEAGPFRFADKLKAAVSELSYLEEKLSLFWKIKKEILFFMYTEPASLWRLKPNYWSQGIQNKGD